MGARGGLARLLLPLGFMGLIFWESSHALPIPLAHNSDKLVHALAYATLALCWFWALVPFGWTPWMTGIVAFTAAALYGIADEIHQSFVPNRDAATYDALADAAGAAIASAIGWLVLRRARMRDAGGRA